ncbi:MAG: hypothetical protein MI922_05580 [Bacteroidales bacterium]|nr:hypothetical protein [Bacteroidales bacterium]
MKPFSAKKMLRALGITAAFVLATQTALSSGTVKFESKEDGKVTISVEDVQTRKVNLSIENLNQDKVYFSSRVSANQDLKKVFDLSKLDNGSYFLVANYENTTLKKEFTVEDASIINETKTQGIYCKPVFRNSEDGLMVLFQCPQKEEVTVAFRDASNTFFTHRTEKSKLAAKYDLNELPSGAYEVVLTAGDYYYTYDVEVQ